MAQVIRRISGTGRAITALQMPNGAVKVLRIGNLTWSKKNLGLFKNIEEFNEAYQNSVVEKDEPYEYGTVLRGNSWAGRVTGLVLRDGSVRLLRQGDSTFAKSKIRPHYTDVAHFKNTFSLNSVHATLPY